MEIKDSYWVNDNMRVGWVITSMPQDGKPRVQVRLGLKFRRWGSEQTEITGLQVLRSYAGATIEGPQIRKGADTSKMQIDDHSPVYK